MAEGMLASLTRDRFDVVSAGLNPTHVHPLAIKVMQEIGIDISRHWSKAVDELFDQEFAYVITLCDDARQTCLFPQVRTNCDTRVCRTRQKHRGDRG